MNPKSDAQWQEAVDCAYVLILIDSAQAYGLVKGGPDVNVDRCLDLLEKGKKRGFLPRQESIVADFSLDKDALL